MPELIEVEQYRRALDRLCGATVQAITFPDGAFVRPRDTPVAVFEQLVGHAVRSTSRIGKLLLVSIGESEDFSIGMRFGMTGRLLIDGTSPIETLEYSSSRNDPAWDRVILEIGGHRVSIRDQRRLGSVELDPDISVLGVEASTITAGELQAVCANRSKAIKAVLLDQNLVAGLGNLLVDETLWQVGVAPSRAAGDLGIDQVAAIALEIVATVERLTTRGGSHTGDTFETRHAEAQCPRCTASMVHETVGGRSTWWCSSHQQ